MAIDPQKVVQLQQFIAALEAQPDIIHLPELSFFRSYMQKMGAKIPQKDADVEDADMSGAGDDEEMPPLEEPSVSRPKAKEEAPEVESEVEQVSDDEDYVPELEESDKKLEAEAEALPDLPSMEEKELTDEEMDRQATFKQEAQEAIEDGDLVKAIAKLTDAINVGCPSALMYSKRADLFFKVNRPMAAIQDCDAAIKINPDSAKPYKIRGKINQRLHRFDEAHKDLELGQKIDFDEDTEETRRQVMTIWKKGDVIRTRNRLRQERRDRIAKEQELKRRRAAAKKAYEEQKKRDEEEKARMPTGGMPGGFGGMPGGMPGGFGGMPGGMPGGKGGAGGMDPSMFAGMMQDPEIMAALSNPKVQQALQEVMSDPSSFAKYQNDPEVMQAMTKIMGKMGGGGMGGMGGMGGKGHGHHGPGCC